MMHKPIPLGHDEQIRLRVESLERFLHSMLSRNEHWFYCAYHKVHYNGNDTSSPTFYCKEAITQHQIGDGLCLITMI